MDRRTDGCEQVHYLPASQSINSDFSAFTEIEAVQAANFFLSMSLMVRASSASRTSVIPSSIKATRGGPSQFSVHSLIKLFYCHMLSHGTLTTPWYCTPLVPLSSHSFTIEILTGSTIIGNYCHYLRYACFTPPGTLKV